VADQIDRVCQLAGHHRAAAIGTDLDGGFGREQAPHGVDRIGDVQKLAEILSRRHYPDHAIEAVFHGNWLRWLRESLPAGEPLSAITSNQLPTASESKIVVNTSHRYKVVVIGAGSIGERHARCFVRTGRAEISLCDVSDSRLSEVASRLTVDRCITQFESVLDAGFDAAVVATPAPLHIPQTKQLLKCGMAVLIEKPLSTTSDGVSELMAIAANQRVAVAYVLRFHSVVAGLQHAVAAGEIGEPLEIMVQSGQHFPFYRPAYRDTYYALRASGGGAIQDALTHFVNAAEWIVGPLTQVQADAQRLVLEGVEVEDTVHVVARHGRVMASYVLNQHQASNESTMTIVGSHGMLRGELHTNTIRLQHTPQEPAKVRTLEVVDRDELFVRQAHSLLDCIEFNRPPVCSLSEAAQTLSAQLAILQVSDNPQWKQVETIHSQHHCSSADPFVERPVRMSPPTCF
jgi:predicted dehydrogenase